MNQHQSLDSSVLLAELEQKNRLIEQLSEELMRYMQQPAIAADRAVEPDLSAGAGEAVASDAPSLELENDDRGNGDLQALATRNQELTKLLQELPEIYQNKFADRLKPIEAELDRLQADNQKLRAEVKSLNYRLAIRNGAPVAANTPVNLPNFANHDTSSISSFGNV